MRVQNVGFEAISLEIDEPRGVLPDYAQNTDRGKDAWLVSVLLRGIPFYPIQGQEIGTQNAKMEQCG